MQRVVVIGAGAAGTMAAIFAARGGADTILIERTKDGGRKILISGGGRCNVLPSRLDESRYVTDSSPNTLRKILRGWPLAEQIAFFEQEVGVPLEEEVESAKLFPASHKARDVRDGLLDLARRSGVRLLFDTKVTGLQRDGAQWLVALDNDVPLRADSVIVATGGLSVPNTGSDGTGLNMLAAMGHTIHPTYAALTPVCADNSAYGELSGISLKVSLTATSEARRATASGGFLFTHRGYSGPSVLNVSHVAVRARHDAASAASISVQWTAHGEAAWTALLQPHGSRQVSSVVRHELPDRLADVLMAQANVEPTRKLAELTRDERRRLIDTLVRGPLPWNGDEGYKKAEVMGGGVRLSDIDPRTMESRLHKGLYLCGEVLDAFGPIGGYNFYWAWVTGRAAGQAVAAG
ncbi:NAD(P)/FAD-dependent oxidoreductase [Gemmatimonas sp.]|uniref:NAD(P)/FAD-dependent oxidoreductase n=1 Tax=Gemmatimonas sp. TaxID=1962908 RepID=UPI003DA53858